jgi:hypothetical protein
MSIAAKDNVADLRARLRQAEEERDLATESLIRSQERVSWVENELAAALEHFDTVLADRNRLRYEATDREERFEKAIDSIYEIQERKLVDAHEAGFQLGFSSREPDVDAYVQAQGAGQEQALVFAKTLQRGLEQRKMPPYPSTTEDPHGQIGLLGYLIERLGS